MTRRLVTAFAVLVTLINAPAWAQGGRASGVVRDQRDQPIRSATVRAENANVSSKPIVTTTDEKGRWFMAGLTGGNWRFTVESPGYAPVNADVLIRMAGTPPLAFTLARDLGPLPGALDRNIVQQIAEAAALRDQGRFDQAIAAYTDIRNRNVKLTAVNLPLADAYRRKAAQDPTPAARRTSLEQALSAYGEVLKSEAENASAQAGLTAVRAELASLSR